MLNINNQIGELVKEVSTGIYGIIVDIDVYNVDGYTLGVMWQDEDDSVYWYKEDSEELILKKDKKRLPTI